MRHYGAIDPDFQVGQRVITPEGIAGRVIFVDEAFSPGNVAYQVTLDNGMGGGTYLPSQLRPVGEGFKGLNPNWTNLPSALMGTASLETEGAEIHTADMDYPEMGSILQDRPDPATLFRFIGSRTASASSSHEDMERARWMQQTYDHLRHEHGMELGPEGEQTEHGLQDYHDSDHAEYGSGHEHIRNAREQMRSGQTFFPGHHEDDDSSWEEYGDASGGVQLPYRPRPNSKPELMQHLRDHGVKYSGDREPGTRFLLMLHDQFHDGQLHDEPVEPHQHDILDEHGYLASLHQATEIYGVPIDDQGDAPMHGLTPRAGDPEDYDSKSTEGDQDPAQNEDPWMKTKDQPSTAGNPGADAIQGADAGDAVGAAAAGGFGPGGGAAVASLHQAEMSEPDMLNHMVRWHGASPDDFYDEQAMRTAHHDMHRSEGLDEAHEYTPNVHTHHEYLEPWQHRYEAPQQATSMPAPGGPGLWSPYEPEANELATLDQHMNPAHRGHGPLSSTLSHLEGDDIARHLQFEHGWNNAEWHSPEQNAELHNWEHIHNAHQIAFPHPPHPLDVGDKAYQGMKPGPMTEFIPEEPRLSHYSSLQHEARVPWTSQERETLHSYDYPTATEGDFVPSTQFTDPQQHHQHADIEQALEAFDNADAMTRTAHAGDPLDEHMHWTHGYSREHLKALHDEGEDPADYHAINHDVNPYLKHGADDLRAGIEPYFEHVDKKWKPMGPVPENFELTRPEQGGHYRYLDEPARTLPARADESRMTDLRFLNARQTRQQSEQELRELTNSKDVRARSTDPQGRRGGHYEPTTPERLIGTEEGVSSDVQDVQKGTFPRHRLNSLDPSPRGYLEWVLAARPQKLGDEELDQDDDQDDVGAKVYKQLSKDFPPEAIEWVKGVKWSKEDVPLEEADWENLHHWTAWREPKKVAKKRKKIERKLESGKSPKRVIMVNRPMAGNNMIADGHHGALAYAELNQPLHAFVAHPEEDEGPWDEMHAQQFSQEQDGDIDQADQGKDMAPGEQDPHGEDEQALQETGEELHGLSDDPDKAPADDAAPGQGGPDGPPAVSYREPWSQGSGEAKSKKETLLNIGGPDAELTDDEKPGDNKPGEKKSGDHADEKEPAKPPSKKKAKEAALYPFEAAAESASFAFHFTASWRDVVAKAKRIRANGGVRITASVGGIVVGQVSGDHDVYESGLQRWPGKPRSIAHWACGCPWASWHQDKSYPGRLNGRPCSHVWALQLEATARMSSSEGPRHIVRTDPAVSMPYSEVVVKSLGPWTNGGWAQTWTAPSTHYPVTSALREAAGILKQSGCSASRIETLIILTGALHPSTELLARHLREQHGWGDRLISDFSMPEFDGQTPLESLESEHQHAHSIHTPEAMRDPHKHEDSGPFQPARLRLVQADQANAPWGSSNVPTPPSPGPYGATEPPQKDMDPGSYGPLAGPDPENWGQISDSVTQDGLRNESALNRVECSECGGQVEDGRCRSCGREMHVPRWLQNRPGVQKAYPIVREDPVNLPESGRSAEDDRFLHEHGIEAALHQADATDRMVAPTYISPVPQGDSAMAQFHENQSTFPFVDTGNTAGPSTSIEPRDPGGIRMEEALQRAFAELGDFEDWPPEHRGRPADEFVTIPRGKHAEPARQEVHPADCVGPECEYDRYHSKHKQANVMDEAPGQLLGGLGAELHDKPEGALDPEGLTAEDTAMGGGQAATGSPGAAEILGEFGASRREAFRSRFAFDSAPHSPARAPGQYPLEGDATGGGPGMSAHDEDGLGWDEPSIQTIGQQQWSGGGSDSDEVDVEPGMSQGERSIVAAFQASAAARQFNGGGGGQGSGDIAVAARAYLQKTAVVSDAEAQELIREGGRGVTARNLDLLDLKGTHYEAEAAAVAKRGLDLDDLDEDLVLI